MRPGQLVVRYQSPWRRRGLAIVGLLGGLLLLYAIYEWGRFAGGYSKFAEVQRRRELAAQIDALEQENEKLRGDIAKAEHASGSRVVAETDQYMAVAAFAGRFAYETWVLPKAHGSRFEATSSESMKELSGLMKRVARAIDAVLAEPAYNWYLHTAPLRCSDLPYYHWHFEIFPRLTRVAGFEWGSGFYINPVSPEEAAAFLRETEVEQHARAV